MQISCKITRIIFKRFIHIVKFRISLQFLECLFELNVSNLKVTQELWIYITWTDNAFASESNKLSYKRRTHFINTGMKNKGKLLFYFHFNYWKNYLYWEWLEYVNLIFQLQMLWAKKRSVISNENLASELRCAKGSKCIPDFKYFTQGKD